MQQVKARPNLENFIARARASSCSMEKFLGINRARSSEKAPVVQARLYYEAALLGRDLALEKETAALVKEMVQSLSPTKTGGYFQLARGEAGITDGQSRLGEALHQCFAQDQSTVNRGLLGVTDAHRPG